MWLIVETCAFYTYMASIVVFIIYRQLAGVYDVSARSDIKKLLTDFIKYSRLNLIWFNLNFVLAVMPALSIFVLEPLFGDRLVAHEPYHGVPFKWIIWLQWSCHLIQFLTKLRVYEYGTKWDVKTSVKSMFDGTDDDYQKAGESDGKEFETSDGEQKEEGEAFNAHYIHMHRKFNEDGVIRWTIFGSIYTVLFIMYLFSSGKEIVYGL